MSCAAQQTHKQEHTHRMHMGEALITFRPCPARMRNKKTALLPLFLHTIPSLHMHSHIAGYETTCQLCASAHLCWVVGRGGS